MDFSALFVWCLVIVIVRWVAKNLNKWYYESKLGRRAQNLPPGDYGWPFIGNMWSYLRAFKSGHPDSFISTFLQRYGQTGLYKVHMFGNPSVIVTTADTCRKVLTDDESFKPGWPSSTRNLIGRKSFMGFSGDEHRWLRKLTAAPVKGHEALSTYINYIQGNVTDSLEKWAGMGQIEYLSELRKLTFRIIVHIFLSSESEQVMGALEKEYAMLNCGIRAMPINIPGFSYYYALKARKKLVAFLQAIITKRREGRRDCDRTLSVKKDMMDSLLDCEDEKGIRLTDEMIIDLLLTYLNAGHESSAHITMWASLFLQKHPDVFKKAKAEQEEIVKKRPLAQKGLTLKEVRQMDYLSKVIDETLRLITISFVSFREATQDVNLNGYTIPKGWKVLLWYRSVHLNAETYPNPKQFDPSRWDGFTPKAGNFLPFGAGTRQCPGNDLAKLEISIFLHHFLLNYELELSNPASPMVYLPHPRPMDNCLGRIRKVSNQLPSGET